MIDTNKVYMIIKTAEGYIAVGNYLSNLESKRTIEFLVNYLSPCIVNVAFSCELYLKAIILIEDQVDHSKYSNGYPETHRLGSLYNALLVEDKRAIKSSYEDLGSGICVLWTLEECIHEYDAAFVGWRYRFEQPNARYSINSLMCFAAALQKVCESLYHSKIE